MSKTKRVASVLLVSAVLSSTITACSSSNPKDPLSGQSTQKDGATTSTTYPIQTDKKLSYWAEIPSTLVGVKPNFAEVPFVQEWQKQTGVKLNFSSPVANQAKEGLNVMLASGDLPDLIEYNWMQFPGGPEKAINDGYILKLNDLIDKYAPNLKKYLKEHPEVDKMVKTDSGSYYGFPFLRGDDFLRVYQGPVIRQDWLDELGLQAPTTIDEWHDVLKAFKEKKGATAPLSFQSLPRAFEQIYNGAFIGAFGIHRLFYLDNNQVKFGPAQPEYKQFMATFRQWYQEGLLDKNIASTDGKNIDANLASGATGATVGNAGGGIGKWMPLLTVKNPKANLVGVQYPVLKKGDTPKFGQKDYPYSFQGMVAISAGSQNAELAVRMLDYGYSEQGHMLFNFGTPGVSYNLDNGYPKYTDILFKNPDKLAPSQAFSLYTKANYFGPFVQDKRYIEQYYTIPQQKDAVTVWQKTDADKYTLPPITATPEESTELAKIMTDINTLVDEMTLKIILGSDSVDNFDKYMEKMKGLKLERALQIQQAALERYNKR
ncbi:extracellular solute-binding protein [Paenibacillus sp. LjRoot153]|uniref:extracellular solute-binding protein n=1 Tax=Paenibacillus sp. LjRoot153 TaxID=3342270 RepID=UPI003ECD66C9